MNQQLFDKIGQYLNDEMNPAERKIFESELAVDKELKEQFDLYANIEREMRNDKKFNEKEESLKKLLGDLNQEFFASKPETPGKVVPFGFNRSKSAIAIAAAIMILLVAYWLLVPSTSINNLADQYIKKDLRHLSQSMNVGKDTIESGIAAYNKQDYDRAIALFESIDRSSSGYPDAVKYSGLAHLQKNRYGEALARFDQLSNMTQLYNNEGKFLKAVTLMKRNKNNDKQEAMFLLTRVVAEKAPGARVAEEWLKKLGSE